MAKIHLQNQWTFYVESGGVVEGRQILGSFQTIQDFWRYWNNIDLANLPKHSTISLMKNNFPPSPEAAEHSSGGKWVLTKRSEDASKLWLLCILSLVGEQFEHCSDVVGTSLSLRARNCAISVWNLSCENKHILEDTEKELCQFLQQEASAFRYSTHSSALSLTGNFGLKIESPIITSPLVTVAPPSDISSPYKPPVRPVIDQDDFSTPFIELENDFKKLTSGPANPTVLEIKRETIQRSPVHRRSHSHEVSSNKAPPFTERRKSCGNLLELQADDQTEPKEPSQHRRTPSQENQEQERLPPRHRRRGKRSVDSMDPTTRSKTGLDNEPSVTFSAPQTQETVLLSVPNRHRRKNSSGGSGSNIVIKTFQRNPPVPKNFLGISQFHWLIFGSFVFVLIVIGFLYFHYITEFHKPTMETCSLLKIC